MPARLGLCNSLSEPGRRARGDLVTWLLTSDPILWEYRLFQSNLYLNKCLENVHMPRQQCFCLKLLWQYHVKHRIKSRFYLHWNSLRSETTLVKLTFGSKTKTLLQWVIPLQNVQLQSVDGPKYKRHGSRSTMFPDRVFHELTKLSYMANKMNTYCMLLHQIRWM